MISLWQNERSARFFVIISLAFFSLLSFNAIAGPPAAAAPIDGKALFQANCASCHAASSKRVTGPGLMGVLSRIPGGDWKYNWVHNSAKVIASGDKYAVDRFTEFNKTSMTTFPSLTNDQIDAILAYVDPGPDEVVASADNGGGTTTTGTNTEENGSDPIFIILLLIVFLVALIAILRYTKINLKNALNEKEGLPEEPMLPFLHASRLWINNNKRKVAAMGFLLFCILLVKGFYALKGVGVYAEEVHPGQWVGYHPSQPINFSHKIHAGDNGIQCQYCHVGVEKSKTAGIPPAMICMNCHRVIDQTKNPGSKDEIAKIYYATGWDPAKGAYSNPKHPLVWNRVNVLSDLVFFSHQQHVVVGKLDCSNCHGDVKSMTTDEQQRPLTMGWCINCHRTTPVQMDGNGYYTALHQKMKEKYKDQPITEGMVGGLECARCHY